MTRSSNWILSHICFISLFPCKYIARSTLCISLCCMFLSAIFFAVTYAGTRARLLVTGVLWAFPYNYQGHLSVNFPVLPAWQMMSPEVPLPLPLAPISPPFFSKGFAILWLTVWWLTSWPIVPCSYDLLSFLSFQCVLYVTTNPLLSFLHIFQIVVSDCIPSKDTHSNVCSAPPPPLVFCIEVQFVHAQLSLVLVVRGPT